MAYDVYIWGMDDSIPRDVILELQSKEIINIKRWIVSDRLLDDPIFKGQEWIEPPWRFYFIKDYERKCMFPPEEIDAYILDNMTMILHNFTRSTDYFSVPMHEVINIVHCLKNHYYYLLKKDNPDVVIFGDLPHYHEGIVLYFLAKAMGIKTILLNTTSFVGEITYCYSLDDYGKFQEVPEYTPMYKERKLENIENTHKMNLAYMTPEAIKHYLGLDKSWSQKLRGILHPVDFCRERYNIIAGNYHAKYDSLIDLVEMKLHKVINKKLGKENYHKRLKQISVSNIDMNIDYVYFPLHLQPEMTTDTMGGAYTDQLLALEKLSYRLPKGWKIYVKENPKQTAYKRGKYFFQRLKQIPNVFFLDRSIDTVSLMHNAKLVATINGTAAWEAAKGGKPAIIFGKNWYDGLPGIFRFHDNIKMDVVAEYKIDREKLNIEVFEKKKKMVPVVFHDSDALNVDDFNEENNKDELLRFFQYILPLIR